MITVIIPLYNKVKTISLAINTVLRQNYQDFEIIIVNDGSTDGSLSVAESFSDPRIRILTQKNAGVSVARNRGIEEAKGKYIAFLDADDEWNPDYLSTQIKMAETYTDCDVFAVNYKFCDIKGNTTQTILRNIPFSEENGILTNYFKVASTSHPPIWTSAVMISKQALQSIGGFPVGITSGEDLLTWARLACRYKIAFSRKICAIYNLGEGYDYSNLPPRRQDEGDPVGLELKKLRHNHPNVKGIGNYISHWHKMRSSVALRYGEQFETILESIKVLWYNPLNYKVLPFIILAIVPKSLRKHIIARYKTNE